MILDTVNVPPAFVAIGYSGLFHAIADMKMSPDEVQQWRDKVPCLLKKPGWMALSITDDNHMVVVRRDADAVVEALAGRGDG